MRNWIRAKLKARKGSDASKPSLPLLPTRRSCALSELDVSFQSRQPRSAFFRMPYEIRRQILVLAFGERIVHVDIRPPSSAPNGAVDGPSAGTNQTWCWTGSVCRRTYLPHIEPFFEDNCRWNTDPMPDDVALNIGALGWLQTSRWAYVEGVNVLYGTNTFHIPDYITLVNNTLTYPVHPLIENLPKLILPKRLATITTLEIMIQIPDEKLLNPDAALSIIPAHFSGLKRLRVHITGDIWPRENRNRVPKEQIRRRAEISERELLTAVDGMYRKFGHQLDYCQVALHTSIFQPLVNVARRDGAKPGKRESFQAYYGFGSYWRDVSDTSGSSKELPGDRGYWVSDGRHPTIHHSDLGLTTGHHLMLMQTYDDQDICAMHRVTGCPAV
ncbi:hypothetical protein HJFPF1_12488 [Paramyrothecium foliicola]|nr:hypothetical protein HJFPF1_12488 [Paramyrothecium foliicola]